MNDKYIQRKDNEGFTVRSKKQTLWKCCDCGLVHNIIFVVGKKGWIGVAAKRNAKETEMGRTKKRTKRRKRRQANMNLKSRGKFKVKHKLKTGRTGSVMHKKLKQMKSEL